MHLNLTLQNMSKKDDSESTSFHWSHQGAIPVSSTSSRYIRTNVRGGTETLAPELARYVYRTAVTIRSDLMS